MTVRRRLQTIRRLRRRALLYPADPLDRLVLVLGAPRSGTTWLAKILDSHPDVVYRHEPDIILRNDRIPSFVSADSFPEMEGAAREYLRKLLQVSANKCAGSLPYFNKTYRSYRNETLRRAVIYFIRALEATAGRNLYPLLSVPDLLIKTANPVYVMKSVSSVARAGLFAAAVPKSRIILLVRHPCGQVASMLRGINTGRFRSALPSVETIAKEAQQLGVRPRDLSQLDVVERCAWHWAILNQKALNDLDGSGRALAVSYEKLCDDPEAITRKVFAFAALDWNDQTRRFLVESATGRDTDDYYRVVRDSARAAVRWHESLDQADQLKTLRITAQFPVGQAYAKAGCPALSVPSAANVPATEAEALEGQKSNVA